MPRSIHRKRGKAMSKEVKDCLISLLLAPYKQQGAIINDEEKQRIDLALSRLGEIIRGKKETVPKLDDKSTFGDTFEFWNISGRNQAISEIAEMFDPQK